MIELRECIFFFSFFIFYFNNSHPANKGQCNFHREYKKLIIKKFIRERKLAVGVTHLVAREIHVTRGIPALNSPPPPQSVDLYIHIYFIIKIQTVNIYLIRNRDRKQILPMLVKSIIKTTPVC